MFRADNLGWCANKFVECEENIDQRKVTSCSKNDPTTGQLTGIDRDNVQLQCQGIQKR